MKSNRYVYPYTPFANLANKNMTSNFIKPRKVSNDDLLEVIDRIQPMPIIDITGDTVAERIFSIFVNEEILFGPIDYVMNNKAGWIKKFNKFIDQGNPLQLTILGFPFKIPVTLKTMRKMPDLGEALSLTRLFHICKLIRSVYTPGAVITIFTEGVFGRFNRIAKKEYDSYKDELVRYVAMLGYDDYLKVAELEEMEKELSDFPSTFVKKLEVNRQLHANGDKAFLKKYEGAKESIYRIVNTRDLGLDQDILMDVYNDDLMVVDDKIGKIREEMNNYAHEMLLNYHSYLEVRDDLDFINRKVPGAITLSVSPKENRLGIIPVAKHCIRLPYHAVVVVNPYKNTFSLEYIIDLKRTGKNYVPVHLMSDSDKAPFYYEEVL